MATKSLKRKAPADEIGVSTAARELDLDTINEASGQLCEAEQLIHAVVELIDASEIDKDDAAPLTAVAYAAIDKIKAAIELIDPVNPKVI